MPQASKSREFFIKGVTHDGRTFRPSDWAERLAGAMSCFRPTTGGGHGHIGKHIGYSPYCTPNTVEGVKCVVINEALRALEPQAWEFVMNFAQDNQLQVVEACLLPDESPGASPKASDTVAAREDAGDKKEESFRGRTKGW